LPPSGSAGDRCRQFDGEELFTPPPPTETTSRYLRLPVAPVMPIAPMVPAPGMAPIMGVPVRVPIAPARAAPPAPSRPPTGRVRWMNREGADHQYRRKRAENEFHGVTLSIC
jgi:hypothetical protein